MDKIFGVGGPGLLRKKDGSVAAGVPASARVVGLFFASSNAETTAAAARVADVCAKTLARGQVLWVVYVSLDAEDAEACAAMPDSDMFVALTQPGVRDRLWADLKLTASPSLVLFEGDNGRLITKNGLRVIREDPEGVKYPWVPQTLDALLGDVLVQSSGREANRREVLAGKHVGLLFAAQWSQPSLKLLEKLYVAYKSIRQRRSDFEIVLVSADKTPEEYERTVKMLQDTWYAKPFTSSTYTDISALFSVHTIPTLVLIDVVNAEIVTYNAHHELDRDPEGKEFPWYPKPSSQVDNLISSCIVT